jgi:N-terminal acetyltransferase B complex catalytic subunit
MNFLETVSDEVYNGFFVDLYVRCTNAIAIDLYEGLGYSVYRRVREYYGARAFGPGSKDEEDAFGRSFDLNAVTGLLNRLLFVSVSDRYA